ncbi:MAG TPA: hypothetical protein VHE55_09485 [Fimbriimonadaceae bacterium]|nr:hypothetical protein [Fimbriimonadaceae bacterium]
MAQSLLLLIAEIDMSAHMLVVRNDSPSERLALISEYIGKLKKKLGRLDGYYGSSAWQSCLRDDEVMILVEFREDRRGDEALRRFSKDKLAIDEAKLSAEPADIVVFDLQSRNGVRPSDAPLGSFLSLSRRVAAPGFGDDLQRELENTFGSLTVIPGYLGHVQGSHPTLPDRVLGIAVWSSEESFRSSLPANLPFELKLFRKIL